MQQNSTDMTRGKAGPLLVSFAVPLILANALQQLYNVVDSAVVGRLLGTEAFAAVGAAGWVYWLVVGVFIGLSHGFSVQIAQRIGAGDGPGMRSALFTAACMVFALSAFLSVLGVLLGRHVLVLLNTPENILDGAAVYLRLLFSGLLITAGYNLLSAALRASGNSRSPLASIVFATLLNIVLDVLFVMVLDMGIAGAALATLFAQTLSCAYCALALHRMEHLRLRRADMYLRRPVAQKLLSLGLPLAIRYSILTLGGLMMQYVINGFGYIFAAGIIAARKVTDFAEQVGEGLDEAMAVYVGQNHGADQWPRMRGGFRTGVGIALVCGALLAAGILLLGGPVVRFLLSDGAGVNEALDYGIRYLRVMAALVFIQQVRQVCRGGLEGLGDTVTPMLASFVEVVVRVCIMLTLPLALGERGIYLAEPAGWLLAGLLLLATFLVRTRRPALF